MLGSLRFLLDIVPMPSFLHLRCRCLFGFVVLAFLVFPSFYSPIVVFNTFPSITAIVVKPKYIAVVVVIVVKWMG